MTQILAVDGGQTGTRWAVVRLDGTVVDRGREGPMRSIFAHDGLRDARRTLSAIRAVTSRLSGSADIVVLALTVIDPDLEANALIERAIRADWPQPMVHLVGDGEAAWAGATAMRPGVVAMAGTGSIIMARDDHGTWVRVGGRGRLLSDEGGGWHIAALAMRAALRRLDRGLPPSSLDVRLAADLGARSAADVAALLQCGRIDPDRFASLAKSVAEAAAGDASARWILAMAARALGEQVLLAVRRLALEEPILIVPTGGVTNAGEPYLGPFRRHLETRLAEAFELGSPRLSNLGGASLLGLELVGIAPDPRLLDRLAQKLSD